MEIKISVDENSDKGKRLLNLLNELDINYSPIKLTAKEAAFGIGRKATAAEIEEYLEKCLNSATLDIDDLIDEAKDKA